MSSRDKNARHEPLGVGGEKSLLCNPGSELRLGGRENRRAKIVNGIKKTKTKTKTKKQKTKNTKKCVPGSKYILKYLAPNFILLLVHGIYIRYTTACDTGGRTSVRSISPAHSTP